MENLTQEQLLQMVLALSLQIVFAIFVFYTFYKITFFINIKLKLLKLKRLSKKLNIEEFELKCNNKAMPILLVHKKNPSKIYFI